MKKKTFLWISLLAIAAIGSYFVWNAQSKKTVQKNIKIGIIMPQTGFLSSPGQSVIKGINLFFDEFNSQNPHNQIDLIFEDSKSDPKTGVNAINKLINVDGIKIIIGDLGSPIFLAMAPIAEQNNVVMISPGASNPKVRNAGDYIFRIYSSDEFDGKVMADYLVKNRNIKKVALLYFNNDYGVGLSKAFQKEFSQLKGNIVLTYSFDENSLDFKDLIIRLKQNNVENAYFVGSPKQDAAFLRQLKEASYKLNIYGVLSFEDSEFLNISRNTFDSVVYTTPYFDLENKDIQMQNFKQNFINKYQTIPDLNSALGYDVANILTLALKNSDFKIERIKDELYKIKNFQGLTGNTCFDEKGDVLKDVMIKVVKGDGSQQVLEVFTLK